MQITGAFLDPNRDCAPCRKLPQIMKLAFVFSVYLYLKEPNEAFVQCDVADSSPSRCSLDIIRYYLVSRINPP